MEIDCIFKFGGIFVVSVLCVWLEWICWKLSSEYFKMFGGYVCIFDVKVF